MAQLTTTVIALGVGARTLQWDDQVAAQPPNPLNPHYRSDDTHAPTAYVTLGIRSLLARMQPPWIAAGLGLVALSTGLLVIRWRCLWHDLPSAPGFWSFTATWLRAQVIAILPTSELGADAFRAFWGASWLGRIQPLLGLLLLERLLGLLGLLLCAAIGLLLIRHESTAILSILPANLIDSAQIPCLVVLSVGGIGLLACKSKAATAMRSLVGRLRSVKCNVPRILRVTIVSGLVHVCTAVLYLCADRALGLETPAWCYLVGVPLINIARFLPIHVAGIGLVEAGLWLLLNPWAGRTPEEVTAISMLVRIMGLVWLAITNLALLGAQCANRADPTPIVGDPGPHNTPAELPLAISNAR